jgi:hypothetical protein
LTHAERRPALRTVYVHVTAASVSTRTIPKRNARHSGISLASFRWTDIIRVNPFTGNPLANPGISGCPENVMVAYIIEKLSNWFESAERTRREAYLASSSDIVDLEKRLRALENNGYTL